MELSGMVAFLSWWGTGKASSSCVLTVCYDRSKTRDIIFQPFELQLSMQIRIIYVIRIF